MVKYQAQNFKSQPTNKMLQWLGSMSIYLIFFLFDIISHKFKILKKILQGFIHIINPTKSQVLVVKNLLIIGPECNAPQECNCYARWAGTLPLPPSIQVFHSGLKLESPASLHLGSILQSLSATPSNPLARQNSAVVCKYYNQFIITRQ